MEEAFIDGQLVLIPPWDEWAQIERDLSVDGISIATQGQLATLLGLLRGEPDVEIGLIPPGPNRLNVKRLMPVVLVRRDGRRQRVHIAHVTCAVCDWQGIAADPTEPDLYIGVADKYAAIDRARLERSIPCPRCGARLPRRAIWLKRQDDSMGIESKG